MKTLIYAILGFVVAGVAAVLVGPSFVNWTAYRSDIAAQLSATTGRKVVIQGDVELEMLPRPAFSIGELRVAGRTGRDLLRARELRVDVRFAPLLRGDVRLARVTLVEPRLVLTRTADGTATWQSRDGARPADGAGGLPLGADLRLEKLRITEGTLIYRDRTRDRRLRLTAVTGRIGTAGRGGPFDLRGRVTWAGVPMRVRANLGRLGGDGPTPFGVTLHPELHRETPTDRNGAARVRLSGALESRSPLAARADLEIRGGDGAPVLARLGAPSGVVARMRGQAYRASATLRLDGGTLAVSELDAGMGEIAVSGNARLRDGPPLAVEADLTLQRLELDRLFGARAAAKGSNGAAGNGWDLPGGMTAEVAVSAPALVYRGQVIRQGAAELRLADGTLRVEQARALLPGGSEVYLDGALTTPQDGPRFDGRIEAASSNLRAVFDWLGVRVPGVAPDRLRRLRLAANLKARPARVTLSGMDLEVDTLTARGGVVAALGGRPGLGVGLRIDRLDLDAYTRDRPAAEETAATDGGETQVAGVRALFDRVDANLDLRVGTLVAGGRQVQAAHLKGTLARGRLTLHTLTAEGVAGGPLSLDGEIVGVAGARPRLDLNLNWQDLQPHAALAWLADIGGVPQGWPAVSVSGQVKGRPGDLRVNLALQALDGLLTARGKLGAGGRDAEGPLPAADLRVALQHDSLRRVLGAFTPLPPLRRDPGGVDLAAQVTTAAQRIRAAGLDGTLGGVPVSGAASVKLGRARPDIALDLETGDLPVAAFAFRRAAGAEGGGAGDWSAAPLGLRALRTVDGSLRLAAEALRFDDAVTLTGVRAEARLRDGILDLADVSGKLGSGTVSAKGTLDASATPRFDLRFAMAGTDARAFGAMLPGLRPAGPVSLNGELRAQGRSERKLVETLTGSGRVAGTLRLQPVPAEAHLLDALFGGRREGMAVSARAAQTVDAAFRDTDLAVAGRWRVADGVLRSDGITLDGKGMTARLSGLANLPDWRTDAALRVREAGQTKGEPFLAAAFRGDLGAPGLRLAGSGLDIAGPDAPADPRSPEAPTAPGDTATPESDTAEGEGAGAADAEGGSAAPESRDEAAPQAEDVLRDLLKRLPQHLE